MISINNLSVAFGGFTLLDDINFHVSRQDRIGLVGKNGAGKSTLLKLICGLQHPQAARWASPGAVDWDICHRLWNTIAGARCFRRR